MAQLLPRRPSVDRGEGLRLETIDDEAADEVFDALSSATARSILAAVYEDPAPASELAEAADTSLQNARYHIEKLVDAGLIEPADTWYSEQGREMTVYAPADESLVVVAGEPGRIASLRGALQRVVGAVALLAAASLVAGAAVRGQLPIGGEGAAAPPAEPGAGRYDATGGGGVDAATTRTEPATATAASDAGLSAEATSQNGTAISSTANGTASSTPAAESTATPMPTGEPTATPAPTADPVTATPDPVTTPVAEAVGVAGPPPELVFFLGGLFVLTMVGGWLHWSGRWSAAG